MHDRVNSTHKGPQLPRTANERMEASNYAPPIEPLFDTFWHTRELGLLFGAAGTGKSMLAMMLAERIARGTPYDGFMMPERRRKVLYVDLKLTDTQFGLRYSDPEAEIDYEFSEDLFVDRPPSADDLVPWLRDNIAAGIGVIIIDDLSAVQRSADGTKHTLKLMRELRELIHEHGVSILVIAGSREHKWNFSVSESDLRRSRVLCDVADSVFGIGHHPSFRGSQYIMQTRARTMPIYWDHTNPPRFTIQRSEDAFIGPKFDDRFAEQLDEDTARLIYRLKQLHDEGRSIRQIADDIGASKSTVERLLKKWTPDLGRYFDELLDEDDDLDDLEAEIGEGPTEEPVNETAFPEPTVEVEPEVIAAPKKAPEAPAEPLERLESRTSEPPVSESPVSTAPPALRHATDADGRDIWIESERRNGEPKVWYEYDAENRLWRKEFRGFYVSQTRQGPAVEAAETEIERSRGTAT